MRGHKSAAGTALASDELIGAKPHSSLDGPKPSDLLRLSHNHSAVIYDTEFNCVIVYLKSYLFMGHECGSTGRRSLAVQSGWRMVMLGREI
jgi:hypothetical protein